MLLGVSDNDFGLFAGSCGTGRQLVDGGTPTLSFQQRFPTMIDVLLLIFPILNNFFFLHTSRSANCHNKSSVTLSPMAAWLPFLVTTFVPHILYAGTPVTTVKLKLNISDFTPPDNLLLENQSRFSTFQFTRASTPQMVCPS